MSRHKTSGTGHNDSHELGTFVEEFPANADDMMALIGAFVAGSLIAFSVVGFEIWEIATKPAAREMTIGNVVYWAIIASVAVGYPFAVRYFLDIFKVMRRKYRLYEGGIALVDGEAITAIPWLDIRHAYESSFTGKLMGVITVVREESLLRFVTNSGESIDCSDVIGRERLTPAAAEAIYTSVRKRAQESLKSQNEVDFGNLFISNSRMRVEGSSVSPFMRVLRHLVSIGIELGMGAAIAATLYFYFGVDRNWSLGAGVLCAIGFYSMRSPQVIEKADIRWDDVKAIRLEWISEGKESYYLLKVLGENGGRPLYAAPVPSIPNFRLFCELCKHFGKPIEAQK